MTPLTLADRIAERQRIQESIRQADARRDAFAEAFGARRIKWSGYNLSRLLRATGERPERVEEARCLIDGAGLVGFGDRRWPGPGGAFDHGEMWGRGGKPWAIVGHPYGVSAEYRACLAELARSFSTLRVAIDDRPSYYGHGTNHVRVELAEFRTPYVKPPATSKTRAASRAARKALGESLGGVLT